MLFLTLTLAQTLFFKRNKTPLFTEQKHTYCEAMSQIRGWGYRRPIQLYRWHPTVQLPKQ